MKHVPLFFLTFLLVLPAAAAADTFSVGRRLGDGSSGRPFYKWQKNIADKKVKRIAAVVKRVEGSNDTYLNARFEGGQTFENGKRFYLKNNKEKVVIWNVSAKPNGKPLIINAYKGVVELKSVSVQYESGPGETNVGNVPKPTSVPTPLQPAIISESRSAGDESEALKNCREMGRRIRRPRVEIYEIRPSGGLFSGKYRIEGVVEGQCIEEAGYYERGRLKHKVDLPFSDRFSREDFSIQVRSGKKGELRAYTSSGLDDEIDIDEEILEYERGR